jgi:hypothetical protein
MRGRTIILSEGVTVENLALARPDDLIVSIVIAETTIPSRCLPPELFLPARATIFFGEDTIKIRVRLAEDADFSEMEDSDIWQAEDPNAAYYLIELTNEDLCYIDLNATWPKGPRRRMCCAKLEVRDPLDVQESLQIPFASFDRNNPGYWIKHLAKKMNQRYGVPSEKSRTFRSDRLRRVGSCHERKNVHCENGSVPARIRSGRMPDHHLLERLAAVRRAPQLPIILHA